MAENYTQDQFVTGPLQNQFNVVKVNKFGSRQKRVFCFEYQSYDLDRGTLAVYTDKGVLKKRFKAEEISSIQVLDRLLLKVGFAAGKGYLKAKSRMVYFTSNADLESFVRMCVKLQPRVRLFRGDEEQPTKTVEPSSGLGRARGNTDSFVTGLGRAKGRNNFLGINSMAIQSAKTTRWSRRFYTERFNKFGQPEGCMVLLSEKLQMIQLRRTATDEVISGHTLENLQEVVQYGYKGRGISMVFNRERKAGSTTKLGGMRAFIATTISESLAFETAGARAEFLLTLKQQKDAGKAPLRTEKEFHPDAAIHAMMAGWVVFRVNQVKGMTKLLRGRRVIAVNVFKGLVHIFKSDDLPAGALTDKADPVESIYLGDDKVSVSFEYVPKSNLRIRMVVSKDPSNDSNNGTTNPTSNTQSSDDPGRYTEAGRLVASSITTTTSNSSATGSTSVASASVKESGQSSLRQYPHPTLAMVTSANYSVTSSNAAPPVIKDVYEFVFRKSSDVTKFQACIQGAMVMSKEYVTPAWKRIKSKVSGTSDAARCSAATLSVRAWSTLNQSWPTNKERVYVGTFNVGDVGPPSTDVLNRWVEKPKTDWTGDDRYALYAFCFQESATKFEDWVRALHLHLGSNYQMVKSVRLWEIALVVFAVQDQIPFINHVEWGSEATGIGIAKDVTGVQLGNKGATAIGFQWHDVSMCFVSAHFVARQERVRLRNDNFQQVVSKLPLSYACGKAEGMELTHGYEHIFFCGDLNYRVDMDYKNAVQHCAKGGWSKLHKEDQLIKEMNAGRVFYGYETEPPNFIPTYRWARGKQEFSNKRDQPPSYTDRVLWKSRPGQQSSLRLLEYDCSETVTISDHRPVRACFQVAVRQSYSWPLHPLVESMEDEENRTMNTGTFSLGSMGSVKSKGKKGKKKNKAKKKGDVLGDELWDEDEDEAADVASRAWYSHDGSFFLSAAEADADGAPEVRLQKVRLHLNQRHDGTQLPHWATLRISSPILQDTEYTLPMPGSEVDPDLIPEDDLNVTSGDRGWNDLYFMWDDDLSVPKLKPCLWDPCYMVTQHLRVSVEQASAPPTNWYLAATSPRSATLDRSKKGTSASSLAGTESGGEGVMRTSTQGTEEDANDDSHHNSAQNTDSNVMVGGAAYLSKKNAIGHVMISFRNVVEAVRRMVANYGIDAWTRDNSPCIPFAEPVMLGGVKVGEISGELQLLPVLPRTLQVVSRLAFSIGDPQEVLKLAKQGQARVQGMDQSPNRGYKGIRRAAKGWHNVSLLLTSDGFLYVLSRPHPVNSRTPPSKGVLEKLTLASGKLQSLPKNFKLVGGSKEQFMFSVSGYRTNTDRQSMHATSTYVVAVGSERAKDDWMAAIGAVQTAGNAVFFPQKSTANFFRESIPKLRSRLRSESTPSEGMLTKLGSGTSNKKTAGKKQLKGPGSFGKAVRSRSPSLLTYFSGNHGKSTGDDLRSNSEKEEKLLKQQAPPNKPQKSKMLKSAYVYSPPPPPPTPPHYLKDGVSPPPSPATLTKAVHTKRRSQRQQTSKSGSSRSHSGSVNRPSLSENPHREGRADSSQHNKTHSNRTTSSRKHHDSSTGGSRHNGSSRRGHRKHSKGTHRTRKPTPSVVEEIENQI